MKQAKVLRWGVVLGLALALATARLAVAGDCDPWIAKLVSVEGTVRAQKAGGADWQSAALDDTFCVGDVLWVGELSRAAVLLPNETVFRIDQSTTVSFAGPEQDTDSLLKLFKGAAHFFTRSPRGLKVDTPFVNAAVGGTEFLVRADDDKAMVSVFEGKVTASNAAGSLLLNAGETAVAAAGRAPVSQIVVRPRDGVQWAIYYPPLLYAREWDMDDPPGANSSPALKEAIAAYRSRDLAGAFQAMKGTPADLADTRFLTTRAALLLTVGRVEEASTDIREALRLDPANAHAYALEAIIAIARNRKDEAVELARKAMELQPESTAVLLANSYVQQAHFDMEGAVATLNDAVKHDPQSAFALARRAELQLSVGQLSRGFEDARRAVELDPGLSRAHLVMGFAHLFKIKIDKAKKSFRRAIELDQGDPLARLGLGLARIRGGDLHGGRQEIEIAVVLDPDNALVRSYLGKAYFDEKRDSRAAEQLSLAKQLDPKDPTPWLYDAVRKRTVNRPAEALKDIQESIRLNDNRAVYRSRLMLDQDLAARSVNLARVYDDLGFSQAALAEGFKSVSTNPADFSAHRFLSDAYAALPRNEIGRVSELLQAQMLQPLNINPIPPRLAEGKLLNFEGTSPADPSFSDYNALFNRNRVALVVGGMAGTQGLGSEEVIHSGVYDWFSYSLGQQHFETDGFRDNNDQETNLYNAFFQASLTPQTSVQGEYRFRKTDSGDIPLLFDSERFLESLRRKQETELFRLGAHHSFGPQSDLLASVTHGTLIDHNRDVLPPQIFSDNFLRSESEGTLGEAQHLLNLEHFHLVTGGGHFAGDILSTFKLPFFKSETQEDVSHTNAYSYGLINYPKNFTWTVGASIDYYEDEFVRISQFNPKFGLVWNPFPDTTFRAAAFRTLNRTLLSFSTLEPTHVAGFSQFFDDVQGTRAWKYGVAVDQKFSDRLFGGVEYSGRDLETPSLIATGEQRDNWTEMLVRSYLYWVPVDRLVLSLEYQFERFEREGSAGVENTWDLVTHSVPIGIGFFDPSGFLGRLKATYVNQADAFTRAEDPWVRESDQFWVLDGSIGYRLPDRWGIVTLEVRNLLDEKFRFQDTNPANPSIFPERTLYGKVTFAF
ncbi:MAG: FecR domain-containing protein [Syntrophobacteraceae bacterium]